MMHFSTVLILFIAAAGQQKLVHCTFSDEQRSITEHATKVKELNFLKRYDTGYKNTDAIAYSTATTEEIQNEIDRVYHQLKCSCLFNAQVHMTLTKNLLKGGDNVVVDNHIHSIWYIEIAMRMVNIFLAADKVVPIHELWRKNDIMAMHIFVMERLEEFTKTECDQDSRFNVKPELIEAMTLHESSQNVQDSSDFWLQAVSINKRTIDTLLMPIAFDDLRVRRVFDYNTLFFDVKIKDNKTMNNLLSKFTGTMDWERTREKLHDAHEKARWALGLDSITYLGIYQRTFIDILKAITLQILWKHMMYLKQISTQTILENSLEFITTIHHLLVEFSNLVGLNQDDSITNLIQLFSPETIRVNFTVEGVNSITCDIKEEIMVISKKLDFYVTKPTNLDTDTNSKSFDEIKFFANVHLRTDCYLKAKRYKPINDSILTLEVFIRYLEYTFEREPVLKAVKSFYKMTIDFEPKIADFKLTEHE